MVLGRRARSCQFGGLLAFAFVVSGLGLAPATAHAEGPVLGPPVAPGFERPDETSAPLRACSFRWPVCVRAGNDVSKELAARALAAGERTLGALDALALPPPLAPLDLFLDASLDDGPRFGIDVESLDGRLQDRSSAFAVIPGGKRAGAGCRLEAQVARAVGFAVAMGLDAGMERGAASAFASEVAHVIDACPNDELEGLDAFQITPERALFSGDASVSDGALLFPAFLDETFGRGQPLAVMTGLLTVAGQRTPAGSLLFANEPDLFDALRQNLRVRGSALDALLLDFAVTRAFVGSHDDGQHLADVARYGDLGRVRIEWSAPFASLPRRFAPSNPIEPTGATYFWLDLAGAPKDAEMTFVAEWEEGVLFRWALIKIDGEGAEKARIDLAGVNGATRVDQSVVGLDGLAGLLVVGVNAGSIDRSHPFDPDEEHAPSSCTVLFAK